MIGTVIGLVAAEAATSAPYGQTLLDAMHRRHPEISAAQIDLINRQGTLTALDRRWSGQSRSSQKRTLLDANGNEIGALVLQTRCTLFTNADEIETELARRIYSAGSLTEPDPFVAGATRAPMAQAMIDDALDDDPTIITLAFHVTPPRGTINSIVASSFGRIGKAADSDDARVMAEGTSVQEITNNGRRIAVELPLLDFRRHIIGALSTSFKLEPGSTGNQMEKRAVALRDALARRTPSLKALFRSATASRQVRALHPCHQ